MSNSLISESECLLNFNQWFASLSHKYKIRFGTSLDESDKPYVENYYFDGYSPSDLI